MQAKTIEFLTASNLTLEVAHKCGRGLFTRNAGGDPAVWQDILLAWAKGNHRQVVVTRHPALVAVLREEFGLGEDVRVLTHATVEDVEGAHVFGVLPLRLAAKAALLTEVSLNLPPELRGVELSVDQVREHLASLETYEVRVA